MSKADLRLDWCSYEAAKYACEKWHYSKRMVASIQKPVKIGVWEGGIFIGAVVFGCGASSALGIRFGCRKQECAELVRVAMTSHSAPVSRIVSIAVRMLKRLAPGLRLIVSFADPRQTHVGTIYQAGNWIFSGESTASEVFIGANGHEYHSRVVGKVEKRDKHGVIIHSRSNMVSVEKRPGKYRYLMPLDVEMRAKIEPLRKPYPKRERSRENAAPLPSGEGAVMPPVRSTIKATK